MNSYIISSLFFINHIFWWKIYHIDVKSTFFNYILKEEVFVKQPVGYVIPKEENRVYGLKKAFRIETSIKSVVQEDQFLFC